MKNNFLFITGIAILVVFLRTKAEELCTEDFLFNTGFEYLDNLGLPVDWSTRGDVSEWTQRGLEVENGILKIWVNESGTHENGRNLFIVQKFHDVSNIVNTLALDTMYLRAWVKTTAVEEPTAEELLVAFKENHPGKDTTGTQYYHNFHSFGGFNLVIQDANLIPGPPFFVPVEWTPWYDHDGAAIEEWEAVQGKVVVRDDVNYMALWIQLRSKSACTVWVDNIQISSSPDFCGESFESPGPVGTNPGKTVNKRNNVLYLYNTMIKFGSPTQYKIGRASCRERV